MLLDDKTFEFVEKSLDSGRKLGLMPIVLVRNKKKKTRRFQLYETKNYHFQSLFNTFICYYTQVGVLNLVCIMSAEVFQDDVLLSKRRKYRLPMWIFFYGALLINPMFILLDQLLRTSKGTWCWLLNSLLDLSDLIEPSYSNTWTPLEKREDAESGRKLRIILKCFYISLGYILPITLAIIGPILYWAEVLYLADDIVEQIELVVWFKIPNWLIVFGIFMSLVVGAYIVVSWSYRALAFFLPVAVFGWYFYRILIAKMMYKVSSTDQNGPDRNSLIHPPNGFQVYRAIYILFYVTRIFAAEMISYSQSVFLIFMSSLIYFTLGYNWPPHERILGIGLILLYGGYTSLTLYVAGQYYSQSSQLLDSWAHSYIGNGIKRNPIWEMERRVVKTFRPLKIYAGSMYFLDEQALLVYWNLVFNRTIDLLIIFPIH